VNNDPNAQPEPRIRALNVEPTTPGPREEVYCTKIGTTHADEMYIVGAHMDGIGWGEAANDDGSGTSLVMELARVFSSADVQTERSIRFILWNNEESGLNGSTAYVNQRRSVRGQEQPAGSGHYPEPKWLGMIQHDMMLFDHGMPRADGSVSRAAARGRRQHRVPVHSKFAPNRRRSRGSFTGEREVRDRLSRLSRPAHDQHRLAPFMDLVPRSACARTSAARRSAAGGIRSGISRPTYSRPSATRISVWASTRRRRRWARLLG
jgi:hypothetical protein